MENIEYYDNKKYVNNLEIDVIIEEVKMHKDEYLNHIRKKLSGYFDIEERKKYEGTEYDLIAKSFVRSEKYLGSKKIIIYAIENTEYAFIKHYNRINRSELENYLNSLIKANNILARPKDNHMCTIITGILIVDEKVDETTKEIVQKFKNERSFMFGLNGWTYIRLVLVQLGEEGVVTNKRGKETKKVYEVKK
ncbi:MAG: hypothetical protein ACLKAK_09090 [Alkaliphilus sp.]